MRSVTRKKKILLIVSVFLILMVGILIVKRDTVRMVYYNLFKTEIPLDTSEKWDEGKTFEHIQYAGISSSDYLDLYVPDNDEPMPLQVLIHGGGFVSGDSQSRQCRFMYQYFRDQGYACASVNYRLAHEAAFPGAIKDVKAAIRFLRANAAQYGYDPDKIAVWGESAGGYLALMAGVTSDGEFEKVSFIGEDKLKQSVSSDVSAIVDFYGVTELGKMEQEFSELGVPDIVTGIGASWLTSEISGTGYDSFEEAWLDRYISDMTEEELDQANICWYAEKNLDKNSDIRIFIRHGDADITVPYLQSQKLFESCQTAIGEENVDYQLFHNYIHADDRFYSNRMLEQVKNFLDESFAGQQ